MKRRGFTLIELLVVIAIIAILAAILFPVFAKVREKGRQIACLSNFKQCALALMQYCQDWDGRLPPYYSYNNPGIYWWGLIAPYTGEGNTGLIGATFMRCPSVPAETYDPAISAVAGDSEYMGYWTMGINYAIPFRYVGDSPPKVSAVMDKLPSTMFLIGECTGLRSNDSLIYSPSQWPFQQDTDGDGIPDTCSYGVYEGVAWFQYNGVAMRHNNGANFVFPDGHAKWVSKLGWLSDQDQIWGDPTADPTIYN
jgi:prepilin-type N-terminal cleavage/methylation domain-containing protein/prepilin-type processing-associated H-X9-DG protein